MLDFQSEKEQRGAERSPGHKPLGMNAQGLSADAVKFTALRGTVLWVAVTLVKPHFLEIYLFCFHFNGKEWQYYKHAPLKLIAALVMQPGAVF